MDEHNILTSDGVSGPLINTFVSGRSRKRITKSESSGLQTTFNFVYIIMDRNNVYLQQQQQQMVSNDLPKRKVCSTQSHTMTNYHWTHRDDQRQLEPG